MHTQASLLQLMSSSQIRLSKSDKKLVSIIREAPSSVIHQSIASLATQAEVSEPTVNRFCHKLGCDGYPDFKLRLAQEISSNGRLFNESLDRDDDSSMVINKIMASIQSSIQSLGNSIRPESLEAAANAIANCKSVNFFGMVHQAQSH